MIIKSIRAFFLLVAMVALVFHMIIPHDHHLAGSAVGVKESCPISSNKSDHRPIFPVHCHVFNDMAAERFSQVVVRQVTQTGFVSVIWRSGYILPELDLSSTVIENSGDHFTEIYISSFSPLRAPPSLG